MFSLRMRSSLKGKHISGAERIVKCEKVGYAVFELLKRPPEYDEIVLKVEKVNNIVKVNSLKIKEYRFKSVEESRTFIIQLLEREGIKREMILKYMNEIDKGANPEGGNMRGAMLVDIERGTRLEKDRSRGVRTVRVDWENREKVKRDFLRRGLTERTVDALAIASKNVYCGVIAEICWSDDPHYVTGYIATKNLGYVRITPLKREGSPFGGRIYFLRGDEIERTVECLENLACLVRY